MAVKIEQFYQSITETLKEKQTTLDLKTLLGKTVIFVIDMVNGFCNQGNLASPMIKALIPKIESLIKKANNTKIKVIALNDHHQANNPEFNSYPSHCLENSIESELVPELKLAKIKVIKKNSTNGFFVVKQKKLLHYQNIIIIGCCTDICILQFALNCKTWANQNNKDCNIIVPMFLTTTFDNLNHPNKIINDLAWYTMLKNGINIVADIK
ncbi:MAG: isochorismatase family cysteine hydrolase [Spiroplasma sp.]|nr:isochorismatase family cysteine hydrolase [Spiroplasma sp.]